MRYSFLKIIRMVLAVTLMTVFSVGISYGLKTGALCSMGLPSDVARAGNDAWDAAIAAGMSPAEAEQIAYAAEAAAMGVTGVKGDFDGDGIPDNQQSAKKSTTTAEKAETSAKQETESASEQSTVENTDKEEIKEEPVHEHNYHKEITTMPTCTEAGIETYTCDCGDSYTEEIPAKGHDEGEWSTVVEPTCTTEGKKELRCTNCNELLDEETIPALGHTPGDWEVTKEADWIHDGEQVKKCTVCGEILETQIMPANHTPLYIIGGALLLLIIVLSVIIIKRRHK